MDTDRGGLHLSPLQLAWLRETGIDQRLLQFFTRGAAATPRAPAREAGPSQPRAIEPVPTARMNEPPQADLPAQAGGVASAGWTVLREQVAACQACGLHVGRSQTVFGTGAIESVDWLVVGEAPGDRDERAGLPFQGKAGELLHAMLAAAGVGDDSGPSGSAASATAFYTNVVKCRPPGSRNPKAAEMAACRPYLLRQVELLRPRRILVLGRPAAQSLLGAQGDMEALRGRIHWLELGDGTRIPAVVTHHPASLLSRPQRKADAWRDLNLARTA